MIYEASGDDDGKKDDANDDDEYDSSVTKTTTIIRTSTVRTANQGDTRLINQAATQRCRQRWQGTCQTTSPKTFPTRLVPTKGVRRSPAQQVD